MRRPPIDIYMMAMAVLAASRATCSRRSVGCVLTDINNYVIATGYNGTPRGMAHCGVELCPGLQAASGSSLDGCMATHAEQNALLQCRDTQTIVTAYVTASPCITCTKLLLNTSCRRIVFLEEYPHPLCKKLWAPKEWIALNSSDKHQVKELFQQLLQRSEYALSKSLGS